MINKILLGILIIFTINLYADGDGVITKSTNQKVNLSGVIIDNNTNETLTGVEIDINGYKTYSDLDGNFQLELPVSENYNLSTSYISYQEEKLKIVPDSTFNVRLKQQ